MIDITKPVRTISGEPVTIISDKGRGHYPLLGYVGDSDQLRSWMLDGAWSNVSSSSSIENYEPKPQLDATAAQSIIQDGRCWTNKDRYSFYDSLTDEQLIERLRNWSPIVRERAAMALGRRQNAPVAPLIEMLGAPSLEARYGACQGLIFLRGRGAPAVDALQKTLAHDDLWLRIKAAEALAAIGAPAMKTVPQPQPEEWAAEKAAFAAGKVIQYRSDNTPDWVDLIDPFWFSSSGHNFNPQYRIKPEPQWVPLESEDIVAGMEFIDQTGDRYQWLFVGDLAVSLDGMWFSFGELMSQGWQYRINGGEWRPCKKEVQL